MTTFTAGDPRAIECALANLTTNGTAWGDNKYPMALNPSDLRIVLEALNASEDENALCLLDSILETLGVESV